jgi:Tfp pilus assembly protein PilN
VGVREGWVDFAASFQQLAKVDYLDGLGVALSAQEMSLVHMTKRFFQVTLRHARTVPLPASGQERLHAFGQALQQFLSDTDASPDQVVVCFPRQAASVSRLMVPETARGSLDQVIGYEVERLLPFSKEDIYYDYITYPVGGDEGRLGVALFCLPRREVEEHLAILTDIQLYPQMVTLSSSAQVSALLSCVPNIDNPCVLIGPEDEKFELSFIEKKKLVASHLFSSGQVQESEVFTDLLAQGITRNLPGALPDETPVFAWGTNGSLPYTIDAEHDLSALASARFATTPEANFAPAALPALGAALQAVGEITTGINVLPVERRAQREKRLSALTLVLAGLVLVLGIAWATGVIVQDRRALNALTQEVDVLSPEVDQILAQQSEADTLEARITVLKTETDTRILSLFSHLSDAIPTDMYLTTFRYKNGGIELSGVATSKPASELVATLNALACLKNVAPKAPFTTTAQGETFTLGAEVEHPCVE